MCTSNKIYHLDQSEPTALVIHCSDPRFQKAFKEFINSELELRDGYYIPLVISGGSSSLSEPLKLPKEYKFMKERIEYFIERFPSLNRIILINHEDCKYYQTMKKALGNPILSHVSSLIDRHKVDLQYVLSNVVNFLGPKIHAELYYARFADDLKESIVFEKILA